MTQENLKRKTNLIQKKEERRNERIQQRLHEAYLMGLRARNFTPAEMIKQAGHLIDFSHKLRKSKPRKINH